MELLDGIGGRPIKIDEVLSRGRPGSSLGLIPHFVGTWLDVQ